MDAVALNDNACLFILQHAMRIVRVLVLQQQDMHFAVERCRLDLARNENPERLVFGADVAACGNQQAPSLDASAMRIRPEGAVRRQRERFALHFQHVQVRGMVDDRDVPAGNKQAARTRIDVHIAVRRDLQPEG